ncbi:MAG: hypothetical protein EOO61_04440 [Hymenobacter sp.]|nr:MAG: hypothetical protein EOO61_04440 [Hymenobacter sp.]
MKYVFLSIALGICFGNKVYGQVTRPVRRPAALVTAVRQTPYAQLDEIARLLSETQATASRSASGACPL